MGFGVQKNAKEANRLFREADRVAGPEGYALAQNYLGLNSLVGEGTPCDPKLAFTYFSKASQQDLGMALFNLADCYMDGQGV